MIKSYNKRVRPKDFSEGDFWKAFLPLSTNKPNKKNAPNLGWTVSAHKLLNKRANLLSDVMDESNIG